MTNSRSASSKPQARMLSIRDVANRFDVCPKTVSRWIKTEGLRAHRVKRTFRIAEEDTVLFMAMHRS